MYDNIFLKKEKISCYISFMTINVNLAKQTEPHKTYDIKVLSPQQDSCHFQMDELFHFIYI